MANTLETKRLVGTRMRQDDLEDLVRMHTDPAVMATLGGRVWSVEETQAFLDRLIGDWDNQGYGVWTLRDRRDGRFVGRAGLRRRVIEGAEETELLFAFMPEDWRKGIATEAAGAIVAYAFERLKLSNLVSFTLPTNLASRRVIEKTGFLFERDFIHAGLAHVLYRLRRPISGEE